MEREPLSGPLRGILCKLGAVLGFICMSIILKLTADEVPPGEQVFFRSFFAIPITLVWLAARGDHLLVGLAHLLQRPVLGDDASRHRDRAGAR